MDISNDIKELISQGKTQQALDLLQENLQGKNEELLNQTYLLEAQYKDLQQKIRLGIEDATTELNRINFTVLSLCDDFKNLPDVIHRSNNQKGMVEKPEKDKALSNALIIFAVIAVVATALVLLLFYASNGDKK